MNILIYSQIKRGILKSYTALATSFKS